jgi:hypothetical protein
MRSSRFAIVAILSLLAVPAFAADQLIVGKKLLIKNPPSGPTGNRVVHLAKDPSITLGAAGGAGDPQCSGAGGGGGAMRIIPSNGGPEMNVALPCENWTTNATNTLYQYKDNTGVSTCTFVMVKNGVLVKSVCKVSIGLDVDGAMAPVAVITILNTQRYCTEFGGTLVKDGSDNVTFKAKDASAPGICGDATPTTTTSTTLPASSCGGSAYPTCGGACPSGETCQAHETVSCGIGSCTPTCSLTGTECLCVPSDGTCDGNNLELVCPMFGSDRPFTFGPCPSGEVCVDSYIGSFNASRHCF